MSHRLPPGTKLSEASLCELFRVSRTTVRKALQQLSHDHIVELRPNRGASVASPTPTETRDIFAARRALEAAIVPLVIERTSRAELQRLKRHVRDEQEAIEAGDRSNWIRLTGSFHLLLADVAGNQVLHAFLSELVSRCSLIIAIYDAPHSLPCANGEHDEIIDAIAAGNVAQAIALMDRHLLHVEQRLNLDGVPNEVDLATILVPA